MRIHEDERRTAYCDLFTGTGGDVNVFVLNPIKPSGWHRHQFQVDQFFVASGSVTVGTWVHADRPPKYLRVPAGQYLKIEPGVWHGYCADTMDAVLVMYLSHKYDDGWDEERTSFDDVEWDP